MHFRLSLLWFRLHRLVVGLWFLPAALSALAVVTVAVATYFGGLLPDNLPFEIDRDGIQAILTILGSSMLTVAVFSLSTLVGAVSRASDNTTPRAVPLIVEDRTAQTSISIFVGAFLFSVVGIIGLSAGIYSAGGRLVLFSASVFVVLTVVVALIRWIARISTIGRTTETVRQVEAAVSRTLSAFADSPHLGCRLRVAPPPHAIRIVAPSTGFIQHIDTTRLDELAEKAGVTLDVVAMPGDWVATGDPLVLAPHALNEEATESVAGTFTIGKDRTFDLDPRYGLIVLSEIAMKALSPGINDTGTAIEALSAQTRVLLDAPELLERGSDDCPHPHVTVPPLTAEALIGDGFRGVGREAAGKAEVALFVIRCLRALIALPGYADAARAMIEEVAARADAALTFEPDRRAIRAAAAEAPA